MDDLSQAQERVWKNEAASQFLTSLDTTPMTKSYKMLTLLAMLNEDQFRGTLPVDKLVRGFARLALRSAKLRVDVDASLDDPNALRRHLERNAIAAWTGGKGTKGKTFFEYENSVFRTTFDVGPDEREAFQELSRELADWRLGEYLDRSPIGTDDGIVCKLSHGSAGRRSTRHELSCRFPQRRKRLDAGAVPPVSRRPNAIPLGKATRESKSQASWVFNSRPENGNPVS